jgi:PAS domain S-box-containing protein
VNAVTEPAMQASEDAQRLRAVLEAVADGVLVFDADGSLTAFNELAIDMWHIPRGLIEAAERSKLIEHAATLVFDPDAFLASAGGIQAERFTPWSDIVPMADGRVFERHVAPYVVEDEVRGTVFAFRDVTLARRAEAQIQEAELRYRTLTERIPAITYIEEAYEEGETLFVSPQIETILGISRQEWLTSDIQVWLSRVHPDDRERVHREYLERLRTRDRFHAEYRMIAADGRVVWFSEDDVFLPDPFGGNGLLHGLLYDITPLKEAEARALESEGRVRVLLDRLTHAQEDERARIAQDIEDELIQSVTGVALRLATLKAQIKGDDALAAIEAMEKGIAAAFHGLRQLVFELRPRTLDTSGLASALRSVLERLTQETGIRCTLRDDQRKESSSGQRLILFRIAQELLANARAHSGSASVDVLVGEEDGGHLIEVSDDGVGFEPGSPVQRRVESLGLPAATERAEAAGGWLRIRSSPGAGTAVSAWLPDARPGGA